MIKHRGRGDVNQQQILWDMNRNLEEGWRKGHVKERGRWRTRIGWDQMLEVQVVILPAIQIIMPKIPKCELISVLLDTIQMRQTSAYHVKHKAKVGELGMIALRHSSCAVPGTLAGPVLVGATACNSQDSGQKPWGAAHHQAGLGQLCLQLHGAPGTELAQPNGARLPMSPGTQVGSCV